MAEAHHACCDQIHRLGPSSGAACTTNDSNGKFLACEQYYTAIRFLQRPGEMKPTRSALARGQRHHLLSR
jgi:hypothetical protein